ncbi:MAG TPA: CopG family transcriptional regulator [Allocoleopsis sp.]
MKAEELDEKFDNNQEDVLEFFDLSTLKQPGLETNQVILDLPQWMLIALDHQAKLLGVQRQALINFWLSERLKVEMNTPKTGL